MTLPVENFFADSAKMPEALVTISKGVLDFQLQRCDQVILACNTAHILAPQLQKDLNLKLCSLIDCAKQEVFKRGVKRLGIVGSPNTIASGIFKIDGVELLTPPEHDMQLIERMISSIIDGQDPSDFKEILKDIVENLFERGG